MKSKLLIFLTGALIWSACSYQSPETKPAENSVNTSQNSKNQSNQADKNAGATNSKQEDGGKLILTGTSKSASYPCNGREVEINEATTTGTYTFTGECKKLTVDGVSNDIKIEKVGEIVVKGVSNKVIYGEGIDGKKPKITKSGSSTIVESKAEAEKRESEAEKKRLQANKTQ